MDNFYISISNGLLKDNHQERMGTAVWQFMWLIDKVTKVDEKGDGWVLGGKPINLTDLGENRSKVTVSRNLKRLKQQGYIEIKHTPYGLIIKVKKIKKRFNKNDNPCNENDKPRFKNDKPNKIIQLDNNSKTTPVGADKPPEINILIQFFREQINPHLNFNNKTERKACNDLIETYGLEKTKQALKFLLEKRKMDKFLPTVTTPYELWTKWAKIKQHLETKRPKLWMSEKMKQKMSQQLPSLPEANTK